MTQRAITDGIILPAADERDAEIEQLRAENRRLTRAVSDAKLEADRAREDSSRALLALRRQLGPLYRALQMVFGELDAAGIEDTEPTASPQGAATSTGPDARVKAIWDVWKQRLPPAVGKVIDALLTHGELNQAQIKVAAGLGTSTVSDSIYKLNKAGLINKNGGRVSLKVL